MLVGKRATLVYCHLEAKLAVERCAGLLGFLRVFLLYRKLFALAGYWVGVRNLLRCVIGVS